MSALVFVPFHISILGYAFVGGVVLTFSDSITRSLAHTSDRSGMEAKQITNREVFRWVFIAIFLGLAALSVFVAIYGAFTPSPGPEILIFMGAIIYLTGCFYPGQCNEHLSLARD